MNTQSLSFPIGPYQPSEEITSAQIEQWINEIASFPQSLKALTGELGEPELNWRYRPGGWTVKQVVHHCVDSHMNALIRFKLALTEESPRIRPYFEDRWAELPDALSDRIEDSLTVITALHKKWVFLLQKLTDEQMERSFIHPEHGQAFSLKEAIGQYAWHGNHHLAHIKLALETQGKYDG